MLINYEIGEEYRYIQKSSSKGTQPKYQKDGYWYKVNRHGYEAEAEYLASMVVSCSNISGSVTYEKCRINDRPGCRCVDFLNPGEEFLTFQNLYSIYEGGNLAGRIALLREVDERRDYVIRFIKDCTGLDCREYLSQTLTLDMLILNEDRHFHNLGVIRGHDSYRLAPIFDNGFSLLCDYSRYPGFLEPHEWQEEIPRISALPLSGSFEQQVLSVGIGLQINYDRLLRQLENEPQTRAKQVLLYQLERYRSELIFTADFTPPGAGN